MARKTEKFIEELKNAPKTEEGNIFNDSGGNRIVLPASLKEEAKWKLREIKKKPSTEETAAISPLEKSLMDNLKLIKEMENLKDVLGEDVFNREILPIIEEKNQTNKELEEQILKEKEARLPERDLGRRKEIKETLIKIAEKEDAKEEGLLKTLKYLPQEVLDYVAKFALEKLGGVEKIKDSLVVAYLAKETVPPIIYQSLEKTEKTIKEIKMAKINNLSDETVRNRLLAIVENTPITSDELKQNFSLSGANEKKEINIMFIEQIINQGLVSNVDLQKVISIAIFPIQTELKDDLTQWYLKDSYRLKDLQIRSEEKFNRAPLTPEREKELLDLKQKEQLLKDKRINSYQKGKDIMNILDDLEFNKLQSPSIKMFFSEIEINKGWRNNFIEEFEKDFNQEFGRKKEEVEKLVKNYQVQKDKIDQLNKEIEAMNIEYQGGVEVNYDKIKTNVPRLVQLEKEFNKIKKEMGQIKNEMEQVFPSLQDPRKTINESVVQNIMRKKEQKINEIKNQLKEIENPPKSKSIDDFFTAIDVKKNDLLQRLNKQKDEIKNSEYHTDFYNKDRELKKQEEETTTPLREIINKISELIGNGSENPAAGKLCIIQEQIKINLKGIEMDSKQKISEYQRKYQTVYEKIEELRLGKKELERKILVIGKARKAQELNDEIIEQEKILKELNKSFEEFNDQMNDKHNKLVRILEIRERY